MLAMMPRCWVVPYSRANAWANRGLKCPCEAASGEGGGVSCACGGVSWVTVAVFERVERRVGSRGAVLPKAARTRRWARLGRSSGLRLGRAVEGEGGGGVVHSVRREES